MEMTDSSYPPPAAGALDIGAGRAAADRSRCQRLAANGRATAHARYGVDRHVAAMLGLYEELVRR